MILLIAYFTAFLIPLIFHSYALIYRKQKKAEFNNILVLSLPLAISAEVMAVYGYSLRFVTLTWAAWILIAWAFVLLSIAVDEYCYADVVAGIRIKFGLYRDQSKITNAVKKKGITYRLFITLIAIYLVYLALYFSTMLMSR
ncbi:hypothetical protein [Gimesia aquarii]|uniref:Uncharacterized protein n=1 Tax=Gimesia aquarii TaxID=2527964 RepID=A0A517WSE4_9PLAN|nr:hypothetical protein [Gimesia aquarii]QDU08148.1 hypothetical protein V202x_15120 [Gimesia aquarii]